MIIIIILLRDWQNSSAQFSSVVHLAYSAPPAKRLTATFFSLRWDCLSVGVA